MTRREPLSSIELDGARRTRVRTLLVIGLVSSALALFAPLLPWHRLDGVAHTALEHDGWFAFFPPILALVFGLVAWSRLRMPWLLCWAGISVASVFGAAVSLVVVEISHLFESTASMIGLDLYAIGNLVLLVVAVIAIVAVPIETVRARNEREDDHGLSLPRAVVR